MQIPLDLIDPPPVYMRDVDTQSGEFLELVDSIRDQGLHNSILVRPRGDRYQLVDGAYRLAAHKHLKVSGIEATVREMDDNEVLVAQLQANAIRRETSRAEYARQLLRIQHAFPSLSLSQLAKLAGKDRHWVRQQLSLLDLRLDYQYMVDRGTMPVLNAYALAKLPPHIQGRYIECALRLPPCEFKLLVANEIQRLMLDAKDRSEEKRLSGIQAPFLRPLAKLTAELRNKSAARAVIANQRPTTHVDAFLLGIQWALNIDPDTLVDRQQKLEGGKKSGDSSEKEV
jgi:ParB/RepB/Spo0J family partition protein